VQDKQQASIIVSPSAVVGFLSGIAAILIFAHFTFLLLLSREHPNIFGLARMFDLNEEGNIPTFFSAVILLLCSGLFYLIWVFKKQRNDSFSRHWGILAIVLMYLSIDEASAIHELVSMDIKRFMDTGWLYYPWVVPGAIVVVFFAAAFARFTLNLPQKTKWLLITAAVVYFGGAIGIEFISGRYHAIYGDISPTYHLLVMLEEGLEITGVLILMFALLDYMRSHGYDLRLSFGPDSK